MEFEQLLEAIRQIISEELDARLGTQEQPTAPTDGMEYKYGNFGEVQPDGSVPVKAINRVREEIRADGEAGQRFAESSLPTFFFGAELLDRAEEIGLTEEQIMTVRYNLVESTASSTHRSNPWNKAYVISEGPWWSRYRKGALLLEVGAFVGDNRNGFKGPRFDEALAKSIKDYYTDVWKPIRELTQRTVVGVNG